MSRDDFISIYRRAGGRKMDNLPFYRSLAMVKLTLTSIQACLTLEDNSKSQLNLLQMGFNPTF